MEGLSNRKAVQEEEFISSSTRTNPYRICGVYCPDILMNIAYGVRFIQGAKL